MGRNIILLLFVMFIAGFKLHAQQKSKLDSLEYFLKSIKEDTSGAWTLAELAFAMRDRSMDSSIILADRAIELSYKLNYKHGLVNALITKGLGFVYKNKCDSAEGVLKEALPLSLRLNDSHELSRVYSALGSCAEQRNDFKSAEIFMLKAIDYSVMTDKNGFTGDIYNHLGTLYLVKGKLDLSVKGYMKAINYFENAQDTLKLSMAYNNIAIGFKNMEKYNDAIKYYNLALSSARNSGNRKKIANRLANLGSAYVLNKEYEKAQSSLLEAIELSADSTSLSTRANAMRYYGWMFFQLNNIDSALYYLKAAYKIAEQSADMRMMVYTGTYIGEVYMKSGKINDAISMLDKSLARSKEMGLGGEEMNCYRVLEKCYVKINDFKKAYNYSTLYHTMKDSILNIDKINEAEELKTQYETEKKNQQIALLNKDKMLQQSEMKRQSAIKNFSMAGSAALIIFSAVSFIFYKRKRDADSKRTEALFNSKVSDVEMKALIAQMNPHFIFNSLRSINEYIQHNKSSLASEYLIKFSKLMRAILENSRKKEIVLSKEIEVLKLYMQLESQRMEHPFSYSFEIDAEIDPENTLIPPMLLQPVVENSIWHGLAPKDQPGKIIIRIMKKDGMIQCEVEDNGIGREVSHPVKKTDEPKQESYGLKIIEERLSIIEQVKKISTRFTIHDLNGSENTSGLNVTFILPFSEAV